MGETPTCVIKYRGPVRQQDTWDTSSNTNAKQSHEGSTGCVTTTMEGVKPAAKVLLVQAVLLRIPLLYPETLFSGYSFPTDWQQTQRVRVDFHHLSYHKGYHSRLPSDLCLLTRNLLHVVTHVGNDSAPSPLPFFWKTVVSSCLAFTQVYAMAGKLEVAQEDFDVRFLLL